MINSDSTNSISEKVDDIHNHAKRPSRRGSWLIAKDLLSSFKYAAQGISYAVATQRNFRIHVVVGCAVFFLGVWLELSTYTLAILVLAIAAVLVLELINTSIEAIVDLSIGKRFNPLARIAKDCAAAAVLVASFSSIVIGFLLILPSLMEKLAL